MNKRNIITLGILALALIIAPSALWAVVEVDANFLHPEPQIFPIGDMVDTDLLEEGSGLTLGSFPDLFWIRLYSADAADRAMEARINIHLVGMGTELLNYWTTWFDFQDWIDYSGGDGQYTNLEMHVAEQSGWIYKDPALTQSATRGQLTSLLDGSNLVTGLYVLTINVEMENGVHYTRTVSVQVYNPSIPTVQNPVDGDEVYGYPVFFSWNWNGGPVGLDRVQLIVVEVSEGEESMDPREIIDNRNLVNTRYEGSPQFMDYHSYTGNGSGIDGGVEQALESGKTYCWMIEIAAPTVLGDYSTFSGVPGMFTFIDVGEGRRDMLGTEQGDEADPDDDDDDGGTGEVLGILSDLLPAGMLGSLLEEFEGYDLNNITIEEMAGKTPQDLREYLNNSEVEVKNVLIR